MLSSVGLDSEVAGAELRQRAVHGKIDIRIDADESPLPGFGAAVFVIVGQETFHALETAPEKAGLRPRAQMRERIVDEDVDRSRNYVIGGRAKFAFLADNLAFAEAVQNGRAFRPVLQLRARDLFQRRQILDQLIDAHRLARR